MPYIPESRRGKSSGSAAKVLVTLIIVLLITTNIATAALLLRTGAALQDAIAASAIVTDADKVEEFTVPSIPVSVMLDYAERDGISIEFLQRFFTDRIVLWDENRLKTVPINNALKKSSFNAKYIVPQENGIRTYEPSGEDISLLGIDVSSYQGIINWKKVKAAGVDYAIVRLGYRGYGTGNIRLDERYETNMTGAISADIPVGVYFYSQAITVEEAEEEAQFVLDKLSGFDVTYPVVFDMEEVNDEDARTNPLTQAERTEITIAFCEKIKAAGYTPMIYGNIRWMIIHLDLARLEGYDKWFAQYFKQPFFPYDFSMWQYTSRGTIDGIPHEVDLNLGLVDYAEDKTDAT
ncbi:glycoside hydrolase family 25 protein [Oscillospiraceae bacterium LTW-04]|nr:glycoside hydrolase family 25 protein [Oscillospiraceae bacterium MB24-C1]